MQTPLFCKSMPMLFRMCVAWRVYDWIIRMTFRCDCRVPISGPKKLPRFKNWAAAHDPEIAFSLPPQVPVKSEFLTVRVKSLADRDALLSRLGDAKL
jgi:hypothetical protein